MSLVRVQFGEPNGFVVQLVRTPACHAGGREFEAHRSHQVSESLVHDNILLSVQIFKCCLKGYALKGLLPALVLISGDDAEVQGATAAIICRISSVGRAIDL